MIKDIKELNFPAYATLETASAMIADMGDRTITSQVKIDGDVVPDFSYDWEVEFKGERYIHPVRTPQGTKDNASRKAKIDIVSQHWAIYEMKRQYFVEMASTSAGTAIADKYIASLGLNLEDFVTAFNLVLNHYFGGRIIINLNPNPLQPYSKEAKFVSISYSYIWDVLQQIYEIYGVRWTLKTNTEGVCEILMGYPAEEVSHIFEYGFEGGLLSVQRQVQSTEIRNRLLGRGGSRNLPYRYFKDKDPNNPLFEADPDWIPELANIAFTELRGKTFRDYVRGWKAKRYGGTPMAEPTEAYLAGYNAEKFDPIEYVDDKESIEKYGVLVGALENNEEIYPSIQGAPGDVDMIVDAEQVTDDDVDAAVENDAVETNVDGMSFTKTGVKTGEEVSINVSARNAKVYFSVPEGKKGTINEPSYTAKGKYGDRGNVQSVPDGLITVYRDKCSLTVHKKSTGEQVSRLNIPPGEYYYEAKVVASHAYTGEINLTASVSAIHLITSTDTDSGWHQTFDIWVRNIWGSSREAGETDQQYADRVWLPILGDRMGDEARVVFASGWLSFSSDWKFPIVGYAFDDSKTGSHWRLTLAKVDAEKDAGRPFIPYEGYNASAGDRFFFIGIDMPYQYVLWAEERLDDFKRDSLLKTAEINPTWVIKTDKVRLNEDREGAFLVDSLNAGAQIRLASKQFISGAYESLYVQSMTYNWTADTILYPDVEIVVSDKVVTVKNPVAQMQGNIETLQRQVGSLSNIQQIIRQVCDQLYLRKDGVEDLSKSPTRFLGKVTGEKFRQGQIGGRDWGIYRDENGNAIFEADKLVARQGILVSDLVVNEATYVGGLQINSAAAMKITAVEETEVGYICYFDQQQGSVTNKFKVDDVALCQKFDPEDNEVKFYKRRVIAVAETSVTLSNTDVNGTGIPAIDDEIIHYGNYNDKTRQFVIIRDVIGGGYERMLMGLDSVTSEGFEYYFAGKSTDSQARWFVGDSKQYAKYENGQVTIKGNLFVTGSDKPITDQIAELDYIKDAFGDGAQGLILGTAVIVGYNDADDKFIPMAGISGVFDKDSKNGGPAAWYGGTTETAKTMFFMNGTGYFASGNIRWDEEGGAEFGGGDLKIFPDGSIHLGPNVKITSDGDETLGTILTLLTKISGWFTLTDGVLLTKYNLASEKEVSSKGINASQGGGSSYNRLDSWSAYDSSKAGYVLSALLGYDLHSRVTTLENAEVDLSDYYTKSETNSQIASAIGAIDLSPYATKKALSALQGQHDTLRSEFDALNNLLSSDTTDYINTWNEVVAFLDGYKDESDLATILSGMNGDIALRLLTSDFNTWVANTYTPLANRVGQAESNITSLQALTGTHTAQISELTTRMGAAETNISDNATAIANNKSNIDKLLGWFKIDSDGNVYTEHNFYSTQQISAKGLDAGSGGGGSSYSRLDSWADYDSNKAGYVLSASLGYALKVAIDELEGYNLDSRVSTIEKSYISKDAGGVVNGGLVVSSLAIAGGTSSQFLKADGSLDSNTYLTSVSWSQVNGRPTNLSQFTDDVVSGNYLPLSGGTISKASNEPLSINNTTEGGGCYLDFFVKDTAKAFVGYSSADMVFMQLVGGSYLAVKKDGAYYGSNPLLHQGNYSDYALPLTGGTIRGNLTLDGYLINKGHFIFARDNYNADWVVTDKNWQHEYLLIHSGNIGDYAITPSTIGSQSVNYANTAESASFAGSLNEYEVLDFGYKNVGTIKGWHNWGNPTGTSFAVYTHGIVATSPDINIYHYLGFANGIANPVVRSFSYGEDSGWKTIAFTDSNVAGAQKLVDGSGNPIIHNDGPTFYIGDTIYPTIPTNILGREIILRYGRDATYGFILDSSGNVGIGTPSPSYNLDVAGDIRATESITIGGATLSWENGVLKVNTSFYSEKEISAKGLSTGGGSGASYNRLDAWGDYDSSKAGYVLSALLGYDLHSRVLALENKTVDLSDYYTKGQTDEKISSAISGIDSRVSVIENAGYTTKTYVDESFLNKNSGGFVYGLLTAVAGMRLTNTETNIGTLYFGATDGQTIANTDSSILQITSPSIVLSGVTTVYGKLQATETITALNDISVTKGLSVGGWGTFRSGLSVEGGNLVTKYDISVNSGHQIFWTDANSVRHGITYDESAGAFKLDGKFIATGSGASLTWSDISGRPTNLSQFTDDVVSGKYLSLNGGSLKDGAVIQLSQYATRTLTISGNSIAADMSKDTGGWAGAFASIKDPVGDTTTMLGWYGGTGGLTYFFLGGTYGSPTIAINKSQDISFKKKPTVDGKQLITSEDSVAYAISAGDANTLNGYHGTSYLRKGADSVGGRNILSTFMAKGGSTSITSSSRNPYVTIEITGQDSYFFIRATEDINLGDKLVLSFDVEGVTDSTLDWTWAWDNDRTQAYRISSNGRHYMYITNKKKAIAANTNIPIDDIDRNNMGSQTTPIVFKNFKLERGVVGSDFSFNPSLVALLTDNVASADYAATSDYATTAGSAPASDVYAWAKKSSLAVADVPDLSGKYLPLSGGTITTSDITGLTIYRDNSKYSMIHFCNNEGNGMVDVGYIGAIADGTPAYLNSGGVSYPLIHSGNIGDYATQWINGNGDPLAHYHGVKFFTKYDSTMGDSCYLVTPTWISNNTSNYYTSILRFGINGEIEARNIHNGSDYAYQGWKTIAFTDSDITGNAASASKVMLNYSYKQNVEYSLVFASRDNIGVAQNGLVYVDYYGTPTYNTSTETLTVPKLHVAGTGYFSGVLTIGSALINPDSSNPYFQLTCNNKNWYLQAFGDYVYLGATSTKAFRFSEDGDALVARDLSVSRNIIATGEISANRLTQGSDIRFKDVISDVTLDLDTIANAPMFRFTWNNTDKKKVYIGSSAQYWKGVGASELVSIDKDDFHRLDYSTLGVLIGVSLAKTTKNHEDRIKELEAKVKSSEKENRRLMYGE